MEKRCMETMRERTRATEEGELAHPFKPPASHYTVLSAFFSSHPRHARAELKQQSINACQQATCGSKRQA
jgi:hypothetical protein